MQSMRLLIGTLLLIIVGMMALQPGVARVIEAYNTKNLVQLQAITVDDSITFGEAVPVKSIYSKLFRCGDINLTLLEPSRC